MTIKDNPGARSDSFFKAENEPMQKGSILNWKKTLAGLLVSGFHVFGKMVLQIIAVNFALE